MAFVWGLVVGLAVAVLVAVVVLAGDRRRGRQRRADAVRAVALVSLARDLTAARGTLTHQQARVADLEAGLSGLEATLAEITAARAQAEARADRARADVAAEQARARLAAQSRAAAEARAADRAAHAVAVEQEVRALRARAEAAEAAAAGLEARVASVEAAGPLPPTVTPAEPGAGALEALWDLELVRLARVDAALQPVGGAAAAGEPVPATRLVAASVEHLREEVGTPAELRVDPSFPEPNPGAAVVLVRVCDELLGILAKHTDQLTVDLEGGDGEAVLGVTAPGFVPGGHVVDWLHRLQAACAVLGARLDVGLDREPFVARLTVRG